MGLQKLLQQQIHVAWTCWALFLLLKEGFQPCSSPSALFLYCSPCSILQPQPRCGLSVVCVALNTLSLVLLSPDISNFLSNL